jgi:hypothetical protein
MKKRPLNFVLSVLAVTFFMLPAAVVQAGDTPPPLAELWVFTPKQGQSAEFLKALADHKNYRAERGEPRAWQVYTPMLGDDLNRVVVRFCCFKWADQDKYEAWSNETGNIKAHFMENVAPLTEKWEHYFQSIDWSNSHWVGAPDSYRYFAMTEFNIKPGSGSDFQAARDAMSQIALNQGWATDNHSWLWATTIGGKAQESIIIPHADFASFDRDEEDFTSFLSRNMGAERAAELMKQFSGASQSTDFQIWEFQKDLSMSTDD